MPTELVREKGKTVGRYGDFWSKVDKSAGPDGCWIWLGQIGHLGYGYVRRGKGRTMAHRRSWELTKGIIPDGLLALHRCDNPPCVNPAHLFLGTHIDNSNDKVSKGRQWHPTGEVNGRSKVTIEQIAMIRALHRTGTCTLVEIGKTFNLSKGHIHRIVNNNAWKETQ